MSPGRAGASRPGREAAWAAAFFLAATVVMTWPQAVHLGDAMGDIWDGKFNARVLQWDYRQTLTDPARLFELNFFHPAHDVLAFSENLWGVSLFGWPLLAAGASPLVNYNVLFLLGMFVSALGAWALARYVTGDALASVVAGLVYAFLPWRISQISHLQHQWGGFLCLLLLFLLRYLDLGERRDLLLFGLFFAWNALSNVHYALFSGFVVATTLGVFALEQGRAGRPRLWRAIGATFVGGLAFAPFALAYHRAEVLYGMKRYFGEVLAFSGRWRYFLSAGMRNRLWGRLTSPFQGPEGDFFPGLAALGLAAVGVLRVRRPPRDAAPSTAPARPRAADRALDALIAAGIVVGLASRLLGGLRLGALTIGDPGRVLVWTTVLVAARLVLAFPARARYANAGDWLRRSPVPPRAALFVALGVVGILVALGGHTPYYRFLFQSVGRIFRSIRGPARGIVLFDLALAVLAAWGLAVILRGRSRGARAAWTAAAVLAIGFEYRAFPLRLYPVTAKAPAVYEWLARVEPPGAVVEWPLGLEYDYDYVFRQAQHGRDLVNGYSGFFPVPYRALEETLRRRPIPESVWAQVDALGGRLLVYHAHDTRGIAVAAYAVTLDRAVASGRLDVVASFPHEEGLDFAFSAPGREREGKNDAAARRLFAETAARLIHEGMRLSPPFGSLDSPAEGAEVAPRAWGFGWALDDSGIDEIVIETDAGTSGRAAPHMARPGLGALYPDYVDADNGGFGFILPDLSPGPHRLTVTLVAKDGGRTSITRSIRVAPPGPAR